MAFVIMYPKVVCKPWVRPRRGVIYLPPLPHPVALCFIFGGVCEKGCSPLSLSLSLSLSLFLSHTHTHTHPNHTPGVLENPCGASVGLKCLSLFAGGGGGGGAQQSTKTKEKIHRTSQSVLPWPTTIVLSTLETIFGQNAPGPYKLHRSQLPWKPY
jgi:hypothetical protein